MKKSLLSLTLLIGLLGVPSLAAVGWKRAWQCRNHVGNWPTRKEEERLARNKCTQMEIQQGQSLWEFIFLQAGPSVAIFGTIAAVAGLAKKWEKKEEERKKEERRRFVREKEKKDDWRRAEEAMKKGRGAVEGKKENPLYQVAE